MYNRVFLILDLKEKENRRSVENASEHEIRYDPSNYIMCIIKCTTNKTNNKEFQGQKKNSISVS